MSTGVRYWSQSSHVDFLRCRSSIFHFLDVIYFSPKDAKSVRCNMFHENGHKTSPKLELISTNIAHKERLNQTLCILNSTLFSLHGSDLFLLGKGGVNQ